MKKHLLFVALATVFSFNLFADEVVKPTTVPAAPTVAEEHVMALYCNHYEGNTLKFKPQSWGSGWETLSIDGTNVAFTAGLAWDAIMGAVDSNDLSGYEKLHFDVWAPLAAHVMFTVEAKSGFKKGVDFALNAGWNTIDADTAWWGGYDWKDLKCVIFENYKNADASDSFDGNPFAFTNIYFWSNTTSVTPPEKPATPKPEVAPATPNHDEADVMAMLSSYYPNNNLNFTVADFSGTKDWEPLELGDDKVKVLYTENMTWAMLTNWDKASYDFSGYKKLHIDLWVPFEAKMTVTFEALGVNDGGSGWKHGIPFTLHEGWNTIDCDPAWWNTDEVTYDWKDAKYIAFEGYKKADDSSAEGNPFAFTNLYWWNDPAPKAIPEAAPAAPTTPEKYIQALFSSTYKTRTFNFEPQNWGGTQWIKHEYDNEEAIWYTDKLYWDVFTNWETDHYNLNDYDMMHADIYVTVDSKIKLTFEALKAEEGGSGWKNGASFDLEANKWNSINVDLLNAPYDSYDFTDLRYLILEGFQLVNGESAEGTPLAITNIYFWNSMTPVENVKTEGVAVKRIVNGQIMIEKDGKMFNLLGTQF